MSIRLSLMVAKASNRVIGRNNKLPWYLPNDLKYFKQVTFGKPVIMGRKTWDSLGKPLPGRTNIVITRQADFQAEGAKVVATLDEAVTLAENVAFIEGQDEAVVMGGAEIYALALPQADRLYLTEVHAEVDGDTWFPEYDTSEWKEIGREDFPAEGPNPYDYSFVVYERK
ncbi:MULTISPECIES: dihydrofolate reductase [unclassified Alcanivorax]|jgi:dihydrofolate reductase|uniref:dihydrofolate reductase n=2 Tax=Alcanivorax TaxID=59753 RepID=UPI000789C7B7|nr:MULTISPECIES: dihydrofolate reductase [unclassified Alcanivorax]MEE2601994.1 dihydrofolate reductase [Pseudomonadota bacterium]MBB09985.1 dihydrofolate reductase [Alcanivorax sp.]MBU83564.1 dihydrofolate reductase [Alcanivorax sp.]MCK5887179.1 dihydrofolate reductase [Alcanivorax sp.]MEE3387122.1 dihydrofolate reductase [Pseudomonadota bacterium]|tara:strand:- start:78 stop:587 length:510 start_codon:yes stop_codon:yes gene_type:complete